MFKSILVLASAAVLAGCVQSPRAYESEPQEVATPYGVVTCQLYTQEIILWDRSISRPDDMPLAYADEICVREGRNWRDGTTGGVYVLTVDQYRDWRDFHNTLTYDQYLDWSGHNEFLAEQNR